MRPIAQRWRRCPSHLVRVMCGRRSTAPAGHTNAVSRPSSQPTSRSKKVRRPTGAQQTFSAVSTISRAADQVSLSNNLPLEVICATKSIVVRADVQSAACLTDADVEQLADPTTATTRPAASHARQRRHQAVPDDAGVSVVGSALPASPDASGTDFGASKTSSLDSAAASRSARTSARACQTVAASVRSIAIFVRSSIRTSRSRRRATSDSSRS